MLIKVSNGRYVSISSNILKTAKHRDATGGGTLSYVDGSQTHLNPDEWQKVEEALDYLQEAEMIKATTM